VSKKRGLGRGLDALLGEPEPAASRHVALARLRPSRRQPRRQFDDEGLKELAESLRTQGMVQPIVVAPEEGGFYTIVAGERRARAARLAGLSEVPVVVRPVADERELLELALVENLQRTDLNPLEEAEAYRALHDDFQLAQEEIAARVGKTRATVANALRLLKLPPEVQELLRAGGLTAGQARPLLSLPSPEEQVRLAERAVAQGLSARDIEQAVAAPRAKGKAAAPGRRQDVHTAAAEEKLTRRLQTRVEIRRRRRGGEIRIHFHSEEELMRLHDLLMQKG
jgi:ParB family chromosome partitioning protein